MIVEFPFIKTTCFCFKTTHAMYKPASLIHTSWSRTRMTSVNDHINEIRDARTKSYIYEHSCKSSFRFKWAVESVPQLKQWELQTKSELIVFVFLWMADQSKHPSAVRGVERRTAISQSNQTDISEIIGLQPECGSLKTDLRLADWSFELVGVCLLFTDILFDNLKEQTKYEQNLPSKVEVSHDGDGFFRRLPFFFFWENFMNPRTLWVFLLSLHTRVAAGPFWSLDTAGACRIRFTSLNVVDQHCGRSHRYHCNYGYSSHSNSPLCFSAQDFLHQSRLYHTLQTL